MEAQSIENSMNALHIVPSTASQFIIRFRLAGISYRVPSTVFLALKDFLREELHADWIQIGAFHQSGEFVMAINCDNRSIQLSHVTNVMNSFTLPQTQEHLSSITLHLVNGQVEGEDAVQSLPQGDLDSCNHEWYSYIKDHKVYEWMTPVSWDA